MNSTPQLKRRFNQYRFLSVPRTYPNLHNTGCYLYDCCVVINRKYSAWYSPCLNYVKAMRDYRG